jgi:cellulose synthase/poly-beta-1,6-N-acetylglucosamine synthase-like glycosyltransferase
MSLLGICLVATCAIVAGIQAGMSWRLRQAFLRPAQPLLTDFECPHVIAVLCLRGTDPFLPTMLRGLLEQDYPRYRVRVVVDSANDPVRQVVEEAILATGARHVEVLVLTRRDRHCAAKNSSLLLGTENLAANCSVVATFDGDAVLHPSCLRELVTPLVRGEAKVISGVRWYAPRVATVGAIARLEWNLGCAAITHAMGLPWGGCLAMSRDIICDPELRQLYSQAFAEDMLLGSYMQRRREKVRFAPLATIVNREDVSVTSLLNFITRQNLVVRMSHHQWWKVIGFGSVLTALTGVICPLGMLVPTLFPWCLAGLILICGVIIVSMALQGRAVRALVERRGETLVNMSPRVILTMLCVLPVTQIITLLANIHALIARPVTWRGLTYQFGRDARVTLIREVPVVHLGHEYNTVVRDKAA